MKASLGRDFLHRRGLKLRVPTAIVGRHDDSGNLSTTTRMLRRLSKLVLIKTLNRSFIRPALFAQIHHSEMQGPLVYP
jgi:hypothetical protein